MHTSLWSFLSVSSQPIFTPPYATLALTSNTYPSSHLVPPQVPFFFNHIPLSSTSQLGTYATFIYSIMVFECRQNIRNQPVSTAIPSTNSFCDITTLGTLQHLGKIFKDIFSRFFFIFQDSMALI